MLKSSSWVKSALDLGVPAGVVVTFIFSISQIASAHELAPIEVIGHYDNAIGTSDAATQGVVGAELLKNRPLLRPAEVLEYIPGMVVTQHSGDGKANQYFLRGVNLDHGTDFSTTLNGVPINMPTHAHGHGYSDLNLLIPELVSRIDYRKGPYFASEGDFSSAGSASITYRTKFDKPFASFTVGDRGYLRAVAGESRHVGEGLTLLSALERMNNNGPWTVPEGMRKINAQFILSSGSAREGWTTSLSAYSASWNSTDQIPQRLIDSGVFMGRPFGLYDSLDSTDGANTSRYSLSGTWHSSSENELTKVEWYAIKYDLNLFSNFTYSLDRASDQFAQTDNRTVLGGKAYKTWVSELGPERIVQNTLGVQLRQDSIRVGLFDANAGQISTSGTVRDDSVKQTLAGLYGSSEIGWTGWLRTVVGVRADQLLANVMSHTLPENSGSSSDFKISPKFSLILGPWHKTEFFFNSGRGFHSNDARGTTAKTDPKSGQPIDPVPGLVSSMGQEMGVKSQIIPDLQTTLAYWRLNFDSELVYVGDAGTTQPGRPSQRTGVEWSNHWTPNSKFLMDVNLAWTTPRYSDPDPVGYYIPNAVEEVANVSLAMRNMGPWSASLGIRYIGAAALIEDASVKSKSSLTSNLRLSRKMSEDIDVTLDVMNLTDRKNNDISYYYSSRLPGEQLAGVSDVHVHPSEPRTLRLTTRVRF